MSAPSHALAPPLAIILLDVLVAEKEVEQLQYASCSSTVLPVPAWLLLNYGMNSFANNA